MKRRTKKISPAKDVSNNFFLLLLAFVVLLVALTLTVFKKPTSPTLSQQQAAQLETDKTELSDFVDDAAFFLANWGVKAYPQFRQKDSQWWKGNQYLFVYDMNGNALVLPPQKELEGTNRWNEKDSTGKYFVRGMINSVKNKNNGWIQYLYPKPGGINPLAKLSYFRKVTFEGKQVIIGSGIYLK